LAQHLPLVLSNPPLTASPCPKVFRHLDSDGGGELEADEFIDGVCGHDEVYRLVQEMSPFQRYFSSWIDGDLTLTNILNALDAPAVTEDDDPVVIALRALQSRCKAVVDRISESPSEEETHPDLQKPFVRKKDFIGLLLECGVQEDWAQDEIAAMSDRLDSQLHTAECVSILTGTADMNPVRFKALEKRLERELNPVAEETTLVGRGKVKVDLKLLRAADAW